MLRTGLAYLSLCAVLAVAQPLPNGRGSSPESPAQNRDRQGAARLEPIVIKTSTLIDGKGHVLKNKELVIENGKIARIADAKQKPTFDLTGMTVMPGWIDTHTHPTWYFNAEGRYEPGGRGSKSTPQQMAL